MSNYNYVKDERPAHVRVFEMSAKHKHQVLWALVTADGYKFADQIPATVDTNYDYGRLIRLYSDAEIDHAHAAVVREYKQNTAAKAPYQPQPPKRGRGRPRNSLNQPKAPSNALDGLLPTAEQAIAQAEQSLTAPTSPQQTAYQPLAASSEAADEKPADFEQFKEQISNLLTTHLRDYEKTQDCNGKIADVRDNLSRLMAQVASDLNNKIAAIKLQAPTVIEIKRPELPETEKLGITHNRFPLLLKMAIARLANGHHNNIWIYGPAGTGKSTACEQLAKALGREFRTNGKLADEFKVMGFVDAHSKYNWTQFRDAYENGHVYCADEIDGSYPDALLAMNNGIANGYMTFPDKLVRKHKDFLFVGAANTVGNGATMDYVSRMKQDAAFMDRFITLFWPIDAALEEHMCSDHSWLARVRRVRAKVEARGLVNHLITPRASVFGASLLQAGIDISDVDEMVLRKGLKDADWNNVKPDIAYTPMQQAA